MTTYILGYTLIVAVIVFVAVVELASRNIIFKNSPRIKAFFGAPLLGYSIRRIGSALVSIILAITATFFLIRFKSTADGGLEICQKAISTWAKMNPEIRMAQCENLLLSLGISDNWLRDLFTYYYNILPFPKTICLTEYVVESVNGIDEYYLRSFDCRTTIMYLGKVFFLGGGTNGQYVSDVLMQKMGISFQIGIIAVVVSLGLGYPMGIFMAKYKDGWFDKVGKTYIITIDAIPGVAYYYIWMSLFMLVGIPISYEFGNFATYLAPALTLGFTGMAGIALWVRRFMLDEFNSDYVKFARSKGISENRIMYTHVLRNAMVPLVRSIPASILGALLGTFYIEKIYNIDGIGGLLVSAEATGDFYVLQGIIIVSALISIVSYLLGDIVTAIVDPRISFTKE